MLPANAKADSDLDADPEGPIHPVPRPRATRTDFWAPSPNSHRLSGLFRLAVAYWGHCVPFRGANVSLSRREHIAWLMNFQRGRLGERGCWNSKAPSQHHLTSLSELYQERGGAHMFV